MENNMTTKQMQTIKETLMDVTQNEPQAFPCVVTVDGTSFFIGGMTLRDWFAGQALSGMMANSYYHESGIVPIKDCYHFADAMIAEREKGGSHE